MNVFSLAQATSFLLDWMTDVDISTGTLDFITNLIFISKNIELIYHHISHSKIDFKEVDGIHKRLRETHVHFNCLSQREKLYFNSIVTDNSDEASRVFYKTLKEEDRHKYANDAKMYAKYINAIITDLDRKIDLSNSLQCSMDRFINMLQDFRYDDFILLYSLHGRKLSDLLDLKYGNMALF